MLTGVETRKPQGCSEGVTTAFDQLDDEGRGYMVVMHGDNQLLSLGGPCLFALLDMLLPYAVSMGYKIPETERQAD